MASKKVFRWAAPLCAVAAALTLGAVAAPAGATETGAPTVTADAPAVASPPFPGRLYGVTAISPTDVWAVGLTNGGTLELHWNGSRWGEYPIATVNGYFDGVASSSAKNVWAVGGTNWFAPSQTLADRWNGRSWARVSTPNPPGGGYFNAVAATSASNAWAVGVAGPGPGIVGPTTPLIEHWNGKGWARVPSPNVTGATGSTLKSVTAISGDNAWAVGSATKPGSAAALTMHWDGRHWTIVPGNTPDGDAALLGVLATWTHNIWAVGIIHPSACSNGGPKCQTLIEHWNSKRWKVLPSPNPPSGYLNLLWAAAATSRDNIWAVGTTDYGSTLIVHWNGAAWS